MPERLREVRDGEDKVTGYLIVMYHVTVVIIS